MAEKTLRVDISTSLQPERAVQATLTALNESAAATGWAMAENADNVIEVDLKPGVEVTPYVPATHPTREEQVHTIRSRTEGGVTITRIEADGVMGAAHGLSWLADRIRTRQSWPPADEDRVPKFTHRVSHAWFSCASLPEAPYVDEEKTRKNMAGAIRHLEDCLIAGTTSVSLYSRDNFIPWGDNIHGHRNAAWRKMLREFLGEAHALRLRVYLMGDEFLYLPEWLEAKGATLSTHDPKFWEALKDKQRELLDDLPTLDGIGTRTGEILPRGDIRAWDPIHSKEDRSLEGNYHRFIKAMHEVVVGEKKRLFLHRTWSVNTWEQHSVPEIYARIFTDEIPTDNFLVSIKLTTGDQWEWQPINPTYGQSHHTTIAEVETARAQDYFSGPPDFSAEFAQAGLTYALERGSKGMACNIRDRWSQNLWHALEYATCRFGWNPYQNVKSVVADWVRAQLSPEVADRTAEILLDLDDVYRDGFHIRGPSLHTWEPLVHARTGWIAKGNHHIDGGRGHYEFLRGQYLQAKPTLTSGMKIMADTVARYDGYVEEVRSWRDGVLKGEGEWFEHILVRGGGTLHINKAYVDAFLLTFNYMDEGGDDLLKAAQESLKVLAEELERFNSVSWRDVPGCGQYYGFASDNVEGIEVFLGFAEECLRAPESLRQRMAEEADADRIEAVLSAAQRNDDAAVTEQPDAPVCFSWTGNLDGRTLVTVNFADGTWSAKHCFGDPTSANAAEVTVPPATPGRCAVKYLDGAHRGWAYVVQQPAEDNGNTLVLMLEDRVPGQYKHDIEVCWVAD